jgi:non-specific serine/threonine protein kinase
MSAADYAAAEQLSQEGLALGRHAGEPALLALALNQLAVLAWFRRDFPTARVLAEEGVAAAGAAGDPRLQAYTLWVQAQATHDLGEDAAAEALAEAALAISIAEGYPAGAAVALTTLGQMRFRRGDLASAHRLLERSLREHHASNFPVGRVWTLGNLGWVLLEQQDLSSARACFFEALTIGRDVLGGRARLAIPLEGFAQLAAAAGQPAVALRLAGAAAALREAYAMPAAPTEQWQLERWLARTRAALSPQAATTAWADGRHLSPEQAIAAALALAVDAAPRRSAAEALTPREREVAALVGQGLGTRALAERLVITEGTVRVHVERILAKLGLHSRAQLAAWAVGQGVSVHLTG